MAPAGTLLLFLCTASALLRPALLSSGTDVSFLDRTLLEKDIAAVFNKVAYGGVTTTKRSISSKYFPSSGSPTTVAPPFTSISVPTVPPKIVTPPTPSYTNPSGQKSLPTVPPMHPTTVPPFTPPKIFPPSFTTPAPREVPSYIPPIRSFFTPPLPPEYANPFADKPTLRGSNSDGATSNTGRRPIPPPPRPPSGRERIPLRPPDLVPNVDHDGSSSSASDRKKPLNTPSFNRSPEAPYSELDKTPGPNNQRPSTNESDLEFVPILHYPSVSRILSGSNGRKPEAQPPPEIFQRINPPESKLPRMPEIYPKINVDPSVPKTSKKDIPPQTVPVLESEAPQSNPSSAQNPSNSLGINKPQPPNIPSNTDSIVHQQSENKPEQLPDPQPQPPKSNADSTDSQDAPNPSRSSIRNKSRLAWDVHVYLIASLFTILALCSLVNIFRVNICKRLLSRGYYFTLHGVLLIIGVIRSVYLFYDAYNVNSSFPEPISHLLLNIALPLLTSAFIVLFIFLLYASKVHVFSLGLQRPFLTGVFITLHILLCITLDLSIGIDPNMTYLPLICQSIFIILCICLGFAYLYAYKHLSKSSAVRKQDNIFGSGFTNIARPTLAVAVRATLATALLSLLMAAVQLYGIFGPYNVANLGSDKTFGWLWWGYQFSVRVIEVSMCFLLSWAGVQPLRSSSIEDEKESQNSGFALFRCGQCNNTPQSSEATDDIYPAVCVTNQAIHDYTVRTGKKVYDDSFPLNNLHSGGFPLPESTISISTSERRSLRKTGYVASNDSPYPIIGSSAVECRSMMKKSGTFDIERPDFDLPFSPPNEVRRSLKSSSGRGGGSGGGGTLISLNGDRERSAESNGGNSSTMERRPMKKSGTLDPAVGFPGIGPSSDVRRSIKKSGTLASLNSERRTPVNQHRGGTQTLCSTRECASPSMLVAENGFVRFRALADPEEQDVEDIGR